jgi:hypothetical protein
VNFVSLLSVRFQLWYEFLNFGLQHAKVRLGFLEFLEKTIELLIPPGRTKPLKLSGEIADAIASKISVTFELISECAEFVGMDERLGHRCLLGIFCVSGGEFARCRNKPIRFAGYIGSKNLQIARPIFVETNQTVWLV